MSTILRDITVESALPVVSINQLLATLQAIDFSNAPTCDLPAATTINGVSVAGIGSITSSSTSATAFSVTNTGVFTGASVEALTANFATTGTVYLATANGLTTGAIGSWTSSGVYTGTGLFRVTGSGVTSGTVGIFTGSGATMLAAGVVLGANMGAATVGAATTAITSGTYTGAGVARVSATGATTGIIHLSLATGATLTTGRYYSANDTTTGEVFGIGANGHIHSTVSAVPPTGGTPGTQNGITAVAITAGGTDTCGVITSTGTSTGGTVFTITFGKTYTTAPKTVMLSPANANAAAPNTMAFVSSITATTFVVTIPAGGTYAATPSWYYQVIA